MNKQILLSAVKDCTTLIELSTSDGSSVIISEYGGRPLGFFPKKDCYSLLWINPDIKNAIKTRNRSIGGDRYWISPERDYFYKKPETWEEWFCPEGLDPGNYEIKSSSSNSCVVSSKLSIINQTTKDKYEGKITREFKLIKEPTLTGLNYCGIEFLDQCVLNKKNLKINGWTLANIISGGPDNPGTVLIPTKPNPKPLSYFQTIPNDRLKIGENHIEFKIDIDAIYKLAVRPEDIDFTKPAKIGYVLKMPESKEYGFLVKISDDIPKSQSECFDVARDHPDSEIGVIQSYNSESPDKPLLKYGEIELQLNPFKTINGNSQGFAKHQLFGYVGSKEEILNTVEKYLGIKGSILF
ncbi:MAG: DUF6786 family protein [Promethearchaeota archaeon]